MSDIKLKPIKPVMVIHCKNKQEYDQLNEESVVRGYGELPCETLPNINIEELVFYIRNSGVLWGYLKDVKNVIEFSDLIEPEVAPEEVLSILAEIKSKCGKEFETCHKCPLDRSNAGSNGDLCDLENMVDVDKVIQICKRWKADHEKKEPEVELQEAARPLVEYLRKNYHPHATAIVSLDCAEVLEGKEGAKYGKEM